ncbi:MAG: hypothetical protein LUE91_02465, partial [Oscillospiraceae bacterium]|nr:hypothetical protein [Oscillospiraceae bacterium]
MDALILSCATGGGHNAAGYAVKEELERRGHRAELLDPYTLAGERTGEKIGNCYIRLVQTAPWLFGVIYQLGEAYRRLPVRSPVYWLNRRMIGPLGAYLEQRHYDVIFTPHIFPGEILAGMKADGSFVPTTICIATDYTCIPFTEETDSDYYLIPSRRLAGEFEGRGIPASRIVPLGIPVRGAFRQKLGKTGAVERLGLDADRRYLLLAGGSIGAGKIQAAAEELQGYLKANPAYTLIVACGSNAALYRKLEKRYRGNPQVMLLQKTDCMAEYMQASQAVITKAGGLSATEAAVSGAPVLFLSPIPGCERKNAAFFSRLGMGVIIGGQIRRLVPELERLQ